MGLLVVRPRRRARRMKVAIDYRFLFRIMGEAIGEGKLLRDIDRDDCKAVRELVSRLPAHANKLYPKLTLKQAAERDVAQDIVAEAPQQPASKPQSVADSPLVKAAQAYGARK